MTDAQILAGIRAVVAEHLDVDAPIEPATELVADLELDSIELLTLVAELENRFRICFDDGDEEGIVSVADLVRRVGERLAAERESGA